MDSSLRRLVVLLLAGLFASSVFAAAPGAASTTNCPYLRGIGETPCGAGKQCPSLPEGQRGGPMDHHWMGRIDELNLSAEQRTRIREVLERYRTRGTQLAQRGSAIRSDFMDVSPDDPRYDAATDKAAADTAALVADGVKLLAEMRRDLNAVLTESQRSQLEEKSSGERQRWEDWRRRHKPGN